MAPRCGSLVGYFDMSAVKDNFKALLNSVTTPGTFLPLVIGGLRIVRTMRSHRPPLKEKAPLKKNHRVDSEKNFYRNLNHINKISSSFFNYFYFFLFKLYLILFNLNYCFCFFNNSLFNRFINLIIFYFNYYFSF